MSADNWAVCPRCLSREEKRKAELKVRARAAYGVMPIEEFDVLRAEADEPIDIQKLHSFREDYEIYGADEGTVTVVYAGSCKVCSLALKFEEYHPIPEVQS